MHLIIVVKLIAIAYTQTYIVMMVVDLVYILLEYKSGKRDRYLYGHFCLMYMHTASSY